MLRSASWCASRTHSKWRSNSLRAPRDGLPSRRGGRPDGYPSNVDRISTGAATLGSNTGVPKNRPILERAAPYPQASRTMDRPRPLPRGNVSEVNQHRSDALFPYAIPNRGFVKIDRWSWTDSSCSRTGSPVDRRPSDLRGSSRSGLAGTIWPK